MAPRWLQEACIPSVIRIERQCVRPVTHPTVACTCYSFQPPRGRQKRRRRLGNWVVRVFVVHLVAFVLGRTELGRQTSLYVNSRSPLSCGPPQSAQHHLQIQCPPAPACSGGLQIEAWRLANQRRNGLIQLDDRFALWTKPSSCTSSDSQTVAAELHTHTKTPTDGVRSHLSTM